MTPLYKYTFLHISERAFNYMTDFKWELNETEKFFHRYFHQYIAGIRGKMCLQQKYLCM